MITLRMNEFFYVRLFFLNDAVLAAFLLFKNDMDQLITIMMHSER